MKRALQVDNRYKMDLRIERKASIFINLRIKSVYGIFLSDCNDKVSLEARNCKKIKLIYLYLLTFYFRFPH